MKHTESDYINAGARYEYANGAVAEAQRIRLMLETETLEDQTEARRLIARGIEEARQCRR